MAGPTGPIPAAPASPPGSAVAASGGQPAPTLDRPPAPPPADPGLPDPDPGVTGNPIAAHYGRDAYPWTDAIDWADVHNILDYGGVADGATDNVAAFNAARDAAAEDGGGVVYFPAGTYAFSDSIALRHGVVIRGEAPAASDAKADGYDPPTDLVFPRYEPSFEGGGTDGATAFKKIVTLNPDTDSHIGIVDVDINRAGIKFLGDKDDGTNRGIVVFGTRTNNVASLDGSVPQSWQHAWQRWPNRFEANIRVQASADVLVANNRVNDAPTDDFEQIGYVIRESSSNPATFALDEPGQATFRYTDHYGIVVQEQGGYPWYATPEVAPGLFREGIVIRDNWVFKTKRVGILSSGQGLVVQGNVIRDEPGKWAWIEPTGRYKSRGSNTQENRGIDVAGYDVTVAGNDYEVYRHRIGWTPAYSTTDGEGILHDNVGSLVNGYAVLNNTGNAYIGIYRTKDIRDVVIAGNTVTSGGTIWVWADVVGGAYAAHDVRIEGNTVEGDITIDAGAGGTGNRIAGNTAVGPRAIHVGPSLAAVGTTLVDNVGFVPDRTPDLQAGSLARTSAVLTWGDAGAAGEEEAGYVVEYRSGDAWQPWPGGTTEADVTTLELTGLSPNTSYTFRVRAFNAAGLGAASNERRFTTPR